MISTLFPYTTLFRSRLGLGAPLGQLLGGEGVVQAEHGLGVLDRRQLGGARCAYPLGGRVLALQLGVVALDLLQAPHPAVEGGIVHRGGVPPVVRLAGSLDPLGQLTGLGPDIVEGRFAVCHARQSTKQSRLLDVSPTAQFTLSLPPTASHPSSCRRQCNSCQSRARPLAPCPRQPSSGCGGRQELSCRSTWCGVRGLPGGAAGIELSERVGWGGRGARGCGCTVA